MYQCGQCGKQFRTRINDIELCIDCFERVKTIQNQDLLANVIQANMAAESIDAAVPMGPQTPKYNVQAYANSLRRQTIMNQIRIQNSQIGIINTGAIENLNQNIQSLGISNKDLAYELNDFGNKVLESSLSDEKKKEIIESVSFVAEEYGKPENKRNKTVIATVISGISTAITTIENLAQIWTAVRTMLGI